MSWYELPFYFRVVALVVLFSLIGLIDWRKHRQEARKWREYLFLFSCALAGALLGGVGDFFTSGVSPEYFLCLKGIEITDSFRFDVAALGGEAGFFAGIFLSALILIVNNPSKKFKPLPYKLLIKLTSIPFISALACGIIMGTVASGFPLPAYLSPLKAFLSESQLGNLSVVWYTNAGVYAGALTGTIFVLFRIRFLRKRRQIRN